MSRLFGPLRQVAFVIRDLDRAIRYWTETLGVGPFFVLRNMSPENYRYRGRASPPPRLSLALGNSGDVQVELIQQHDDRPSAYIEFLQAGREGFQHVSSWLTRADYDATMERERAAGVAIVHEGSLPGSGVRFAYFATDEAPTPGGLLYEIADVLEPQIYPVMQLIRDAARDWDGADPVREITV
jgi:catechol 2,3-dioxygenase-like lactoylglutathione lyase family enzyme